MSLARVVVVVTGVAVVVVVVLPLCGGSALLTVPPPVCPPADDDLSATVVEVVDEGTVVAGVVDATVVVVVDVPVADGSTVQIAHRLRPPAGIEIDWPKEYEVPLPIDEVSHLDKTYPLRVKPEPSFKVTDAPAAAVWLEMAPEPPFDL
jgi:hypothetical protein